MPYCPKCRYEYRAGFSRCPDCDVSLVEELPAEKVERPVETVCVASYQFEIAAQMAKTKLEAHGIPAYLVNEIMSVTADISIVAADNGVKLNVRKEDAGKARKVLAEKH
ncbi:MAG: DUF2007 domain-containing protein [Armatimonadetes bacterium]|nr:DUF2007 domain-containing protein [Armatimonadota bacterium]